MATTTSAPGSSSGAQEIEQDLVVACGHFEEAARLVTVGLDTTDVASINQAAIEMQLANAQLPTITQKIEALTP